ncbi:MAG TPA: hypothetical protein VFQ07_17815 [Candidatus Polarisedimenticolia bacterium]|nr:hypothetical protein [Candidatus Polarisedimenticolia bacterium]
MHSLSLAAGDFDENGVEDVVAGYSSGRSGIVALFLGDGAARIAEPAVRRAGETVAGLGRSPFLPEARLFPASEIPDVLRAGDFDGDGHLDLLVGAAQGHRLALLPGDGKGGFAPAAFMRLPGALTSLVTGEVNRRDGLPEILAGLRGPSGAWLAIYESPAGSFGSEPESIPLDAPATDLLLADLDGDPWRDIAAVAGRTLMLVHGRDRGRGSAADAALVEPAKVDHLDRPGVIAGVQGGDFDGDGGSEIAVLESDRLTLLPLPSAGGSPRSFARERIVRGTLLRTRGPFEGTESLLLLDRDRGHLAALVEAGVPGRSPRGAPALDLDVSAAAVLPMRLNADGLDDLVLLREGAPVPAVILSAFVSTFTVTTLPPGDGVCDATCTLAEALAAANASPGADLIQFNIPPAGCKTMLWAGGTVSDTVTIDGTTQPGSNGGICITLDGGSTSVPGVNGPTINAPGSVVRGLGFTRFGSVALTLRNSGVIVESCSLVMNRFMGVDMGTTDGIFRNSSVTGMFDGFGRAMQVTGTGNQILACSLTNSANVGVTVGGSGHTFGSAGNGNTISGSGSAGLDIGASGTVVQGNRVTGTSGVFVRSTGNTIGGTAPGAGNSIWANNLTNLSVTGSQHLVQGNNLGANDAATCFSAASAIDIGGSNVTLGGLAAGAGNLVCTSNSGYGVTLSSGGNRVLGNRIQNNRTGVYVDGSGHTIQSNRFQGNALSALDLAPSGPTPNDAGDPDAGANDLQNYPVLQAATCAGGITGLLDSTPGASFTLEFYNSPACHPSGFGEGETSLGLANVTTDAAGQAAFGVVPAGFMVPGKVVTATATSAGGSTSEFSACVTVAGTSPVPLGDSVQLAHDATTAISTLTWSSQPDAMGGDTYRGTIPINYMGSHAPAYNHTCFEDGDAAGDGATVSIDPDSPALNEAFYYLVAARNACGRSGLGTNSTGAPRPKPAPCP